MGFAYTHVVEHMHREVQAWLVDEGGGGEPTPSTPLATTFLIIDKHNTAMLVNDRSAERFVEAHSDLSALEIALTPDICKVFKYLSSCPLTCPHRAGVTGRPAEQLEQACQASFRAAGSTGSSGGFGSGSGSHSHTGGGSGSTTGGGSSSTAPPRSRRSSCTPTSYSDDTRVVDYRSTRWSLREVCVGAVGPCVDSR
jgi:hypothetical protein